MYITVNDFLDSLMRFAKEMDIYSKMRDALYSAARDKNVSVCEFLLKHVETPSHVGLIVVYMDIDMEELQIIMLLLRDFFREECRYKHGDKIVLN